MHYVYLRCAYFLPIKQNFVLNVLGSESWGLSGSSFMGYTRSLLLRAGIQVRRRTSSKSKKTKQRNKNNFLLHKCQIQINIKIQAPHSNITEFAW